MKFSEFEKNRMSNRFKAEPDKGNPQSLKSKVDNYPGRVVTTNAALLRMRNKGVSIKEACLTPCMSKKPVAKEWLYLDGGASWKP